MAALFGIMVGAMVMAFGRIVGFDRDRAFYPVVLIVTASYYVLFATIGGVPSDLLIELVPFVAFTAAAVWSFRAGVWIAAAGFAAHGAYDLVHPFFASGRGMPDWWPAFCLAIDVVVAAGLALFLLVKRRRERA